MESHAALVDGVQEWRHGDGDCERSYGTALENQNTKTGVKVKSQEAMSSRSLPFRIFWATSISVRACWSRPTCSRVLFHMYWLTQRTILLCPGPGTYSQIPWGSYRVSNSKTLTNTNGSWQQEVCRIAKEFDRLCDTNNPGRN